MGEIIFFMEKNPKKIEFSVSEEEYKKINQLASQIGLKRSSYAKMIVIKEINENETKPKNKIGDVSQWIND